MGARTRDPAAVTRARTAPPPAGRPRAAPGGAPAAALDGLLRDAGAERRPDLPPFRHQSGDLLPLVAPVRSISAPESGRRPAHPPPPARAAAGDPPDLVAVIRAAREAHPRWGKRKLAVVLRREGWSVSVSTVGRTLARLRARGRLHEPPVVVAQVKRQKGRRRRPYARRKPWGYVPHQPGDLVQVDTTTITLYPAVRRVHFTAR